MARSTCLGAVAALFLTSCVFDPAAYEAAVYARELDSLESPARLTQAQKAYSHLATGAAPSADAIAAEVAREETATMKQLFGTNWGLGPAFLFGGQAEVESATIVGSPGNERVRVTEEHDEQAIALLETHYFFTPGGTPKWGHGPFMALGLGTDDAIEGLGTGWMAGFLTGTHESNVSFNVALGAFLDENVQQLGSGFKDGQPPPAGETSVRFREEDEWRAMVLFSFRFNI